MQITPKQQKIIDGIMDYQLVFTSDQQLHDGNYGYPVSRYVFEPELRQDANGPYIKWGCWTANFWFTQELGPNSGNHLANAKKRLLSKASHRHNPTVTIEKIEED